MWHTGDKPLYAGDVESRETERSLADSKLGLVKGDISISKERQAALIVSYSTGTFGQSLQFKFICHICSILFCIRVYPHRFLCYALLFMTMEEYEHKF